MGGRTISRGIGLGIAAMAANVAVAFLLVWIYSIAVAPGHDTAFYSAFADRVAPLSDIVAGFFILAAAGYWMARLDRAPSAALIPALAYVVIDMLLLGIAPAAPPVWTIAISGVTKIAAAWLGGRLAAPKVAQ